MPATISLTIADPPDPPANYHATGFEVYRRGRDEYRTGPGPSGLLGATNALLKRGIDAGELYANAEWSGSSEEFEAAKANPHGWEVSSVFDAATQKWGPWVTF